MSCRHWYIVSTNHHGFTNEIPVSYLDLWEHCRKALKVNSGRVEHTRNVYILAGGVRLYTCTWVATRALRDWLSASIFNLNLKCRCRLTFLWGGCEIRGRINHLPPPRSRFGIFFPDFKNRIFLLEIWPIYITYPMDYPYIHISNGYYPLYSAFLLGTNQQDIFRSWLVMLIHHR